MTEKINQVLQVEPQRELTFHGPFTDVVTSNITLKNPSEQTVCFKVKTTAPRQYCVRPNTGLIAPGSTRTVVVMLQPMDSIPGDSSRHKFMVQACFSPSGSNVDLENIFKSSEDLMYSKLLVTFENSGVSHVKVGSQEEAPAPVYINPTNETPSKSATAPVTTASTGQKDLDEKLRAEANARRSAEQEQQRLKRELDEMFKKNARLQQQSQTSEVGLPMLQVILISIAALLIGLIVGKLF